MYRLESSGQSWRAHCRALHACMQAGAAFGLLAVFFVAGAWLTAVADLARQRGVVPPTHAAARWVAAHSLTLAGRCTMAAGSLPSLVNDEGFYHARHEGSGITGRYYHAR